MPTTRDDVDYALLDQFDLFSAVVMSGDFARALKIGGSIPFSPEGCKNLKRLLGKDVLLRVGVNTVKADAAYGKGWLDEPDEL